MGKYDLDSVYDEKATYTLYDLADEVTEELNEKRYSKKKTEKTDNILNITEIEAGDKEVVGYNGRVI